MTLRRLATIFLWLAVIGSLIGIIVLAFNIDFRFPLTPMITMASFTFAILHAGQREGWRNTIILTAVVFVVGLAFESIGVATGLVYGPYHYTDQLGPKFLNLVPYLIPVAWTYMMYPSLIIAESVTPSSLKGAWRGLFIAAVAGVVMTAWDVVMDPMMVCGGNWVWDIDGAYFGVPIQNFFGWWLTTFAAMGAYLLLRKRKNLPQNPFPEVWPVYLYGINALTSIIVSAISGLAGSALAGFFATIPWFIWGWAQTRKNVVSTAEK